MAALVASAARPTVVSISHSRKPSLRAGRFPNPFQGAASQMRLAASSNLSAQRRPLLVAAQAVDTELVTEIKVNTAAPSYMSQLGDKYAVIDVGGTQQLVEEGRWYCCNRLKDTEPGSKVRFGRVLALKSDGVFTVGRPYLENVAVEAEVLEEMKGPKLKVFKFRAKKHYRRTTGHRQLLTKFLITRISP